MSGLLAAHRLQQAGVAVRRSSRRTTTSAARGREHAIRAAASTTRTTTTATRSRSATTGRSTSRPRTCCSTTSATAPTTFGLREHIRFGTEVRVGDVVGRRPRRGRVRVRDADGTEETLVANAVDQRGRPAQPAVASRHRRAATRSPARRSTRRAGTTTSTSRGKRVAVIGTGASAVQFIPEIAPRVGELLVFQRTPPWLGPTPDYHDAGRRRAALAVRARAVVQRVEPLLDLLEDGRRRARRRPRRSRLGAERRSRSARSTTSCALMLTAYLEARVRRPPRPAREGRARRTRPAPSGCSATTASGPRTLKRDNVQLVTDAHPRDHADGRRHRRRRRARRRRDHLRHRLPGVEVPHADEGHRPRRRRPARAVGRRRPRLPRHHGARLPEPLLPLRAEHEHRHQRQHHLLLRVRRALHPRLPRAAARDGGHAPLDVRKDVHDEFNERVDAENRRDGVGLRPT